MALTADQIYKLGVEALGWNNSTAAGKAVIAEDLKLLKRLQLAHGFSCATSGARARLPAVSRRLECRISS